jgi:hypothetical protein
VAAVVSSMLQTALGQGACISTAVALTEERSVWRCHLKDGQGSLRSVIARTKRELGGWRTDPSYLCSDYAATAFLWDVCPGVSARIIAADVNAGLYVTEDLGMGPSLGELLAGTARSEAAKALVAFASVLGRMHAATAGLDGEYYGRRQLLGPDDPIGYRTLLGELSLAEAANRVLEAEVSGRSAPREARVDVHGILAVLNEPGPLLAISNGDPCPYNCVVANGAARLFDFELAGYRHALLDVAYLHLGFQWCYQPGRIPPEVLREAEAAYRVQAGAGIPAILDELVYQPNLAAAVAAWAILSASMVIRHVDRGGTLQAGDAARHVATVHAYIETFGSASCYPAVSRWVFDVVSSFSHGERLSQRSLYSSFDRCTPRSG